VTTADFDGDGKPDIAVANLNGNSVNILPNTSSGPGNISFGTPLVISLGTQCRSVAAVDLDGDGKLDLVTANFGNGSVGVVRNTSSGPGNFSFAAPTATAIAGSKPSGLAVGDFNGDNKPDIAAADFNSSKVYVLLNQSGSLPSFTTITTAGTMQNLAEGDFNGDGITDLAAGTTSAKVSIFYGLGNGNFTAANTYTIPEPNAGVPRSIATADFNGDNAPDLIVSYNLGSRVLLNQAAADSLQITPGSATPAAGGTFSVTVRAQANGSTYQNFTGTVTLTSDDPSAPILGTHTFVPGEHGSYTFSVSLPNPGAVTIRASFGSLAATTQVTVVGPGTAVVALPGDTVGVAYNQTITPSGGTGPYTLTVSDVRNAILGLNVPSGGTDSLTIDGTPTAAGTMVFTVTSTDSLGGTTTTTYSVTVNPALTLSPMALPADTLGIPYIHAIWARGGTGPVTLAVANVQNAIPGLVVPPSGSSIGITGTPTAAGTMTFTVTATDALGATSTAT
jgi:hypothetical protein